MFCGFIYKIKFPEIPKQMQDIDFFSNIFAAFVTVMHLDISVQNKKWL